MNRYTVFDNASKFFAVCYHRLNSRDAIQIVSDLFMFDCFSNKLTVGVLICEIKVHR